jgi:hypothetical protein
MPCNRLSQDVLNVVIGFQRFVRIPRRPMRVCLNCGIVLCEVMKGRERERERERVRGGGGGGGGVGRGFSFITFAVMPAREGIV